MFIYSILNYDMWIKITLVLAWFVTYLTVVASFFMFIHLFVTLKQMNLRNKNILSKYFKQLAESHDILIKKLRKGENITEKELNTYLSLLLITDHKVPKKLKIVKNLNKKTIIKELRNINNTHKRVLVSEDKGLSFWIDKSLEKKVSLSIIDEKVILVTLAIYVFFPKKELIGYDKNIHPVMKEIFLDKAKENK